MGLAQRRHYLLTIAVVVIIGAVIVLQWNRSIATDDAPPSSLLVNERRASIPLEQIRTSNAKKYLEMAPRSAKKHASNGDPSNLGSDKRNIEQYIDADADLDTIYREVNIGEYVDADADFNNDYREIDIGEYIDADGYEYDDPSITTSEYSELVDADAETFDYDYSEPVSIGEYVEAN